MSDSSEAEPELTQRDNVRCLQCDSVIPAGSRLCIMCGAEAPTPAPTPQVSEETRSPRTPPVPREESAGEADVALKEAPPVKGKQRAKRADEAAFEISKPDPEAAWPTVFEAEMKERRSYVVAWMTGIAAVIIAVLGVLVVQYGGPVQLALIPTATPIPPTPTFTPTATAPPTQTSPPTPTPTMTLPPTATETPQPPRTHRVGEGETLFGLSLLYNVSMDSIAALNGFSVESPIQLEQALQVPWPTATPPLAAIALEINGETVVADPTDCERVAIEEGDAISVIAARYNIDFEILQQVNRLTEQSILQPGDTICIPTVTYGGVLPPTPGPSPTASSTSFPAGPYLLFPPEGRVFESLEQPIVLQWVAVKDLMPDEWYMVELSDLTLGDAHPRRGFTQENAFRVPGSWRPVEESYHEMQWRVSIVRVQERRADGSFVYGFGGRSSEPATFTWLGAVPTATPTSTPTPSVTPTP